MGPNGWLIVASVVIVILAIIVFLLALWWGSTNNKQSFDALVLPFSGFITPGGALTTKDGSPQIQCPPGKKCRILGAYFQVYDPYLECSTQATPQFVRLCENQIGGQTGCTSSAGIPQCNNIDPSNGYRNCTCYPDGPGNCKIRDCSAQVAKLCDGSNSCPISLDSNNVQQLVSNFGPLPCNIVPSSSNSQYTSLPVVSGNPGNQQAENPVQSTTNQGYYVHGVYTCE